MFGPLARVVVRRRRAVLVATAVLFAVAAAAGVGVKSRLGNGGFVDPDSEAARAAEVLARDFPDSNPNVVLLVTARRGDVDGSAVDSAGRALTAELAAEPGVDGAVSYWSLGHPEPLRSTDARQALVLGAIAGDEDTVDRVVAGLAERYTRLDGDPITVEVTGFAQVIRQIHVQAERDLIRAEVLAFPIIVALLLLVFGSVVAALLPVAVGAIAIVGTMLSLLVLTAFTDVSVFALNLTTMLGLGLAVDYSLFVVSRFREELQAGLPVDAAVERTVLTAGRTVAFSALTLAVSLAAMAVLPIGLLQSMAYAGFAVALIAALGATVFLPALLATVGTNIDRWSVRRRPPKPAGEGFWYRVPMRVMRHPVTVTVAVLAVLLVLGAPFLHARFGPPDDRWLPQGASSRAAAEQIRTNFPTHEDGAMQVVAPTIGDPRARTAEIDEYARALAAVDGVARVDAMTGVYWSGRDPILVDAVPPGPTRETLERVTDRFAGSDATWLSIVPSVDPGSSAGIDLLQRVRSVGAPFPVSVGGRTAEFVDSQARLGARLPLAIGIIALATFVLLFLAFGSIVVPLKALAINVLSLSATFGALVFVFQEGHFAGALGFTPLGSLDSFMPMLLFCGAFGLSLDYEVFLLARIKEEYDRTGDNARSIALGLDRSGRIVTAAAILISGVFAAFTTGGVTPIKLIGVGLTLAVLMDAFVIRPTLVPAVMKLAGRANWWAPAPLRRLHRRVRICESLDLEPAVEPDRELITAGSA